MIEIIIGVVITSVCVYLILFGIVQYRKLLNRRLWEKSFIIEYHQVMEIFELDCKNFESNYKKYKKIDYNDIVVTIPFSKHTYPLSVKYTKEQFNSNTTIYRIEISFPDFIYQNDISFFGTKSREVFLYE